MLNQPSRCSWAWGKSDGRLRPEPSLDSRRVGGGLPARVPLPAQAPARRSTPCTVMTGRLRPRTAASRATAGRGPHGSLPLDRRIWQMVPTCWGGAVDLVPWSTFFGSDPAEVLGGQNASAEQTSRPSASSRAWTSRGVAGRLFLKSIVDVRLGPSYVPKSHSSAFRHPAGAASP